MIKKKVYRNKKGEKLYPVCSWEKNQHKLYNAHDRVMIRIAEEGYTEELADLLDKVERALCAFDAHVIGPTVYATWEDGRIIKDFIGGYDMRHDMKGDWKA